jgi:hypothetical protein
LISKRDKAMPNFFETDNVGLIYSSASQSARVGTQVAKMVRRIDSELVKLVLSNPTHEERRIPNGAKFALMKYFDKEVYANAKEVNFIDEPITIERTSINIVENITPVVHAGREEELPKGLQISKGLQPDQLLRVKDLLITYKVLFSNKDETLTHVDPNSVSHAINTNRARSISTCTRRASPEQRETISAKIANML